MRKHATTDMFDIGLALATSLTETFCRTRAFVIIATHFQQLTSVGYVYRNVSNHHFDVIYTDKILESDQNDTNVRQRFESRMNLLESSNENNTIIYSYTLRPGICQDLHYGSRSLHSMT
jgi:DNA mismatch repair ATPase MutS